MQGSNLSLRKMKTINCAICDKKEKTVELYPERLNRKKISGRTYSARRTPDGMHHRFVRCNNCGLIFSNPILPPREIEKFYKKSSCTYGAETENIKETYFKYFKDLVGENKKVKVLDVGCGNGFFLEMLKDHGFESVYGVEPGKESVKAARQDVKPKIKTDILKPGIFKNGTFDVITCFQTLDHIIDVGQFLQLVKKILKPGGRVLFVVHDTEGLSVKLLGEKSPIFDIEHIYLFNKENLEKLFKKNGFKKITTSEIRNKYSLNYLINMAPAPKFVKSWIKRTLIGRLPIEVSLGNIGITASS